MRSYCAARMRVLSRVRVTGQKSPLPGAAPNTSGAAASIWRYELSGELPAALSVQLTMQTTKGWYRVAAPIVPMLEDDGTYLTEQARFKRFEVHSPAQFFELPPAAGQPTYVWVSRVGDADASLQVPCPPMWIRYTTAPKHKKKTRALTAVERELNRLSRVKRLNPSVYRSHALPRVGAIVQAHAVPEPASETTCRHPFRHAKVRHVVAPSYPAFYDMAGEATAASVAVMVEIAPNGSAVGSVLVGPSGRKLFDDDAIDAASQTTYFPEIGLCVPVPGYYIFMAEYMPN